VTRQPFGIENSKREKSVKIEPYTYHRNQKRKHSENDYTRPPFLGRAGPSNHQRPTAAFSSAGKKVHYIRASLLAQRNTKKVIQQTRLYAHLARYSYK
jgi:hypothetical protein